MNVMKNQKSNLKGPANLNLEEMAAIVPKIVCSPRLHCNLEIYPFPLLHLDRVLISPDVSVGLNSLNFLVTSDLTKTVFYNCIETTTVGT